MGFNVIKKEDPPEWDDIQNKPSILTFTGDGNGFDTTGKDFYLYDSSNTNFTAYFWRDKSDNKLYIGTSEDIPTTREDLQTSAGEIYWHSGNFQPHDHGGCTFNLYGMEFENGNHAITANDGKGNFNFRVGHTALDDNFIPIDETITEDGYPFHQEYSQTNGWQQWNIGASGVVGDPVTWEDTLQWEIGGKLSVNSFSITKENSQNTAIISVGDNERITISNAEIFQVSMPNGDELRISDGVGSAGFFRLKTGNYDIVINSSTLPSIQISGLPTTNPGGTDYLWKDSNGYLRIT